MFFLSNTLVLRVENKSWNYPLQHEQQPGGGGGGVFENLDS